jgi:hypothetical protein
MSCRAYLVYRVDCDCGFVDDLSAGEEPPDECPECGDEVEVGP